MEDSQLEIDVTLETPASNVFIPPSIVHETLLSGASYTHFSPVPPSLLPTLSAADDTSGTTSKTPGPPCVLGIDEAGRGPVLGPMVYGAFYLPVPLSTPLLSETHHFDDSKVLTPIFRSKLMEALCTPPTRSPTESTAPDAKSLYANCGWAVEVMSARDISANMLKPFGTYNLNAQAMDATISLIQRIYDLGVNIKEIYIDTIGQPAAYQKKLERVFPTAQITVAKKADSLYPCVSAASVCAKVTRDAALEVLYTAYGRGTADESTENMDIDADEGDEGAREQKASEVVSPEPDWGSGYPSDVRCTGWMKRNMDPVFGWGNECRFSWGTTKDLLETKGAAAAVAVTWPAIEDDENSRVTDYFGAEGGEKQGDELANWFGTCVTSEVF
jgi:ribonuclease H2 subunit A